MTANTPAGVGRSSDEQRAARRRRRFVRLSIAAVLLTVLVVAPAVTILPGAAYMWATVHPQCADGGRTPAAYNLAFRDIRIPARGGVTTYRGFFIPGTLAATILLPPTFQSGRDGPLVQMAMLAGHGYNVVTFESRVCSPKGVISLGYREVDDVGDALAYLKANPDHLPLSPGPIGIYGFSSAGATATMAMARYPDLAALISEGGYHDTSEIYGLGKPSSTLQRLAFIGTQLAYRLGTGADPANLAPIDAVPKIPPRPVLFIYGSAEISLPGARLQLAAVRAADPHSSAELWVVPGANHGGYLAAVGAAAYAGHVLPFFDCALLALHCDQYRALWTF